MEPVLGQLGFDLDAAQSADDHPLPDCARNQATWWGFSLDHDAASAVNDFRRRFGHDPEQVRRVPGCLLLGPLADM